MFDFPAGTYKVVVSDVLGKEVMSYPIQSSHHHESHTIDFSSQPKGVYLIQVLGASLNKQLKAVVE
jgi:hypothetical protein